MSSVDAAQRTSSTPASLSEPHVRTSEGCKGSAPRQSVVTRAGRSLERRVNSVKSALKSRLAPWGTSSGIGAAVYYLLSGEFSREQRAFLSGKRMFRKISDCPTQSCSMLRRNTHRLEKGLVMRPLRTVFALDYIEETMKCYEAVHANRSALSDYDRGEIDWAHDVLAAYFDVAGSHPLVDALRDRFHALPARPSTAAVPLVPYRRDLERPLTVRFDDLLALSLRRRSVRWFLQQRVPRKLIENAVQVAAQSPSACNRQPFVFRIFDDPELARRVGGIPAGTTGFSDNFPAVVVVVGQQRHYFDERDRHVIYIDGALASMSFVYALETLGLSSCCINWPDIEDRERAMEQFLELEPDERPIMLIAFGYPDPDGLVPYSQKKSLSQLCRFNFESELAVLAGEDGAETP